MNFAFYGSDQFSIKVLEELAKAQFVPSLIVTNPDRPKGRAMALTPTPVKEYGLTHGITVLTPDSLFHFFSYPQLANDFAVVASYGKIIPQVLLEHYRHGMINVHPSLLPKFRGATPLQNFILSGETETGVTIMEMDVKMDHGPILDQKKFYFPNAVYPELRDALGTEGGKLLAQTLPRFFAGEIKPVAQDDSVATFTKLLIKEDGELDLDSDSIMNDRKFRAFCGNIGTYFVIKKNGQSLRVKIEEAHLENDQFVITKVTPAGKNTQTFAEFSANYLK